MTVFWLQEVGNPNFFNYNFIQWKSVLFLLEPESVQKFLSHVRHRWPSEFSTNPKIWTQICPHLHPIFFSLLCQVVGTCCRECHVVQHIREIWKISSASRYLHDCDNCSNFRTHFTDDDGILGVKWNLLQAQSAIFHSGFGGACNSRQGNWSHAFTWQLVRSGVFCLFFSDFSVALEQR